MWIRIYYFLTEAIEWSWYQYQTINFKLKIKDKRQDLMIHCIDLIRYRLSLQLYAHLSDRSWSAFCYTPFHWFTICAPLALSEQRLSWADRSFPALTRIRFTVLTRVDHPISKSPYRVSRSIVTFCVICRWLRLGIVLSGTTWMDLRPMLPAHHLHTDFCD